MTVANSSSPFALANEVLIGEVEIKGVGAKPRAAQEFFISRICLIACVMYGIPLQTLTSTVI